MKTHHRIIIGDSRRMSELEDESAHLVVTSPPYWQLKDYGDGSQIGFNDSYQDYINNLNLVWHECHRVLHKGCRLCVNIGDQFARSVYYGRYKVIPIRTEIIKFCEAVGFDYMGAIIWQKVTTCNTTGGATIMGSFPYPRNGIVKLDYEFILLFKKPGAPAKVSREVKEASKLTKEEWNLYFAGHWNFAGAKQKAHLAMFPLELPRRLIRMFTFVGETALDPFLGSGTTSLAAKELGRDSIGYEINADFLPLIKEKLGAEDNALFPCAECECTFDRQKDGAVDFREEIKNLPYVFEDLVQVDRKADRRKDHYGSKISKNSREREQYFTVKRIISPEILELSNGERIRLIGIKEDRDKTGKAVDFLAKKVDGQKVFLRSDDQGRDDKNNLLCYLYLKNRTFVNAHLIKNGLVDIDHAGDHKYASKFETLWRQRHGK